MEEMAVLIMEKDKETGYLSKEMGTYSINYDMNLIQKVFTIQKDEERVVNLYLTIPGEFKDWEFNAILDNYDIELYKNNVQSIEEDEESYNPTWIIKFDFQENDNTMEKKLNEILEIHSIETSRVLNEILELEDEYRQ